MTPETLYLLAGAGIAVGSAAIGLGVVLRARQKERAFEARFPNVGPIPSREAVRKAALPWQWPPKRPTSLGRFGDRINAALDASGAAPLSEAERSSLGGLPVADVSKPAPGEPPFRSRRSPRPDYGRTSISIDERGLAPREPLSAKDEEALRRALREASAKVADAMRADLAGMVPLSAMLDTSSPISPLNPSSPFYAGRERPAPDHVAPEGLGPVVAYTPDGWPVHAHGGPAMPLAAPDSRRDAPRTSRTARDTREHDLPASGEISGDSGDCGGGD